MAQTVEQQLEWERSNGTFAAICAAAAAILMTGAQIGLAIALRDAPAVSLIDGLEGALGAGLDANPGLRAAYVIYLDEQATALIIGGTVFALGALALIGALGYLYRATRFRRPETPAAAGILVVVGALLVAIGSVGQQLARAIRAGDFAQASDQTSEAARDALNEGAVAITQLIGFPASLALGFAFMLVSLNAMRAGLLTKFMGYLGVFVAILFVLPLGAPVIIQSFWLLALAVLFMGRWPSGVPEAWQDGQAHPWPTAAEMRERYAAQQEARAQEPEDDGLPDGEPSPATAKRKRKRRR